MDDENLIEKNVRMKADIAAYVNESIGVSIVSIHSQIFWHFLKLLFVH